MEQLNAAKTFEPLEAVLETDIPGFLKNERENTILSVIEESKKQTFADIEAQHWRNVSEEWEKEKEKILNSLLGSGQELASLPSEIDVSVLHGQQASSGMDAVEMAYSREVYARNEKVKDGLKEDLVTKFCSTMEQFQDKQILDCWQLLKTILDVRQLPEKAYRYRGQTPLQKAFIAQSRMFLERRYYDYIAVSVSNNLYQAERGGQPGTFNLIRSFLNLRHLEGQPGLDDGRVAGHPTWAMIYYCFRCGDLEAAAEVVRDARLADVQFLGFFQEYCQSQDRRLSPSSESSLQMIYRRSVRASTDPYKKAMYCLLARCDFNDNHPDVVQKTDDYIWMKLCQVELEADEPKVAKHMISDKLTLVSLQHLLLEEYGEDHFNASQNPYLYFQVLVLTQQFEAAIEFLYRIERLKPHAVHFAIALKEHDLLHLTESPRAPLLEKKPGKSCLNFSRMIIGYTRKFSFSEPREVLQYLFLLKGMLDDDERDLFVTCVTELALENKGEYEMLLGKIEPNGTVRPGCISKFVGDTSEIISRVAEATEARGMPLDAVRLYDLAQDCDRVLEILSQELSRVVSLPCTPHSDKERVGLLAVEIAQRYKTQAALTERKRTRTLFLLMDVMQFFDLYHDGKLDIAIDIMKRLKFLPLSNEPIENCIKQFQSLTDEIRTCYAAILLATMSILHSQYRDISARVQASYMSRTPYNDDGGAEKAKTELRSSAKALITFAGMLPLHLPGDTYARLVQMEVLMQ